jgi:hypothetical protein
MLSNLSADDWENCDGDAFRPVPFEPDADPEPFQPKHFQPDGDSDTFLPESFECDNDLGVSSSPI